MCHVSGHGRERERARAREKERLQFVSDSRMFILSLRSPCFCVRVLRARLFTYLVPRAHFNIAHLACSSLSLSFSLSLPPLSLSLSRALSLSHARTHFTRALSFLVLRAAHGMRVCGCVCVCVCARARVACTAAGILIGDTGGNRPYTHTYTHTTCVCPLFPACHLLFESPLACAARSTFLASRWGGAQ